MDVRFSFNVICVILFNIIFVKFIFGVLECGKPIGAEFRLEEDRIVQGYDIGYYRYPWYVALTRHGMVSCGAALIGPSTIITAAHCYKEFLDLANKKILTLEQVYIAKLGVYNICTTEPQVRDYTVKKVHIHELYFTKKPYYDICLIKVEGDTSKFRPLCLPSPTMKIKPPEGTVPGLGTLRYHGAMPCTVHEARLLIHNDSECFQMINGTGNNPYLIHNAFCAGYIQGGVDTCQGDSGGPLQSMNENGDYVLIGIVSFGFRCALPGLLGMYTDVSSYLDWIQEKSELKPGELQISSSKPFINNTGGSSNGTIIPTGGSQIIINTGGNHHHHSQIIHLTRPYRRPIKVIVYRNNAWHVMTKSLLHHPFIREKQRFSKRLN